MNHVEKKYIFLYFIKTFIYIKSFIYINQVYIDIIRIDIFIFQIGIHVSQFFYYESNTIIEHFSENLSLGHFRMRRGVKCTQFKKSILIVHWIY